MSVINFKKTWLATLISSATLAISAQANVELDGIDMGMSYKEGGAYSSENGKLTVKNGASFTSLGTFVVGENKFQTGVTTQGDILISGPGTVWNAEKGIVLGKSDRTFQSQTNLTIDNSAVVNSTDRVRLAAGNMDEATFVIKGAGTELNILKPSVSSGTASLVVGEMGKATLSVLEGAKVTTNDLEIATDTNSRGEVTVAQGSSINVGRDAFLGDAGVGVLTVHSGGELIINNGNGVLDIARRSNSVGTLNVGNGEGAGKLILKEIKMGLGRGQINFDYTTPQMEFSGDISGGRNGIITKSGSGQLTLSGDNSKFSGKTSIYGGLLEVDNLQGTARLGGDIFVDQGAALKGNASSLMGNINTDGLVIFNQNKNEAYAQVLSGRGVINKQGSGRLLLVGDNAQFTGLTQVKQGILQVGDELGNGQLGGRFLVDSGAELAVSAASVSGDIKNNGLLRFTQFQDGQYNQQLSGVGEFIKEGSAALSLSGDGLAFTGVTRVKAGALRVGGSQENGRLAGQFVVEKSAELYGSASSLRGNIQSDGKTQFDQVEEGEYSDSLSGTGSLVKQGHGILTLSGDVTKFTGVAAIERGTLWVSSAKGHGHFGGDIWAKEGTTLQGSGKIDGDVYISPTATHKPGELTSGSQTIGGNYANDGVLSLSGTPDEVSHIVVAGKVNITNTQLNLDFTPDRAAQWNNINKPLTLIDNQSNTQVTGQFVSIKKNLLFLDPMLNYQGGTGNDVVLTWARNDLNFTDYTKTPNQKQTARGIDSMVVGNPVWQNIALTVSPEIMRNELDLLSGEIYPTTNAVLFNEMRFQRDAMNESLRRLPGKKYSTFNYASEDTAAEWQDTPVVWSRGFGSWGDRGATENNAGVSEQSRGMIMGIDIPKSYGRLGASFGYGRSNLSQSKGNASGDITSYYAGIYTGNQGDNLALRSGIGIGWHKISTVRDVALQNYSDEVTGDYRAQTYQLFSELGYKFSPAMIDIEPFASVAYLYQQVNDLQEEGKAAALNVKGNTQGIFMSSLGSRIEKNLKLAEMPVNLHGTVAWQHYYSDVNSTSTVSFRGSDNFIVSGTPQDNDKFVLEAGANMSLSPGILLGVAYKGDVISKGTSNNLFGNVIIHF